LHTARRVMRVTFNTTIRFTVTNKYIYFSHKAGGYWQKKIACGMQKIAYFINGYKARTQAKCEVGKKD
jgi:hypothetical protein